MVFALFSFASCSICFPLTNPGCPTNPARTMVKVDSNHGCPSLMSQPPNAFLVTRRDDGFGDVYPLQIGMRYKLGRAPTNKVLLKDDLCSREHAEVFPETDGWYRPRSRQPERHARQRRGAPPRTLASPARRGPRRPHPSRVRGRTRASFPQLPEGRDRRRANASTGSKSASGSARRAIFRRPSARATTPRTPSPRRAAAGRLGALSPRSRHGRRRRPRPNCANWWWMRCSARLRPRSRPCSH